MAQKKKASRKKKAHRWRLCPSGKHWVSTYPKKVKPSKKNPDGITTVDGHCRLNRSRKDQIYQDEMASIAEKHFAKLKTLSNKGLSKYSQSKKFDNLIQGWTKYWNEVLKPKIPLDPLIVKALIATESSFRSRSKIKAGKRAGFARGLMQVTDWTIEILEDEKGELRDYLVNVDQKDMTDPNLNIAAGVRWLFRKQETASAKLKKQADWIWTVADYKSYLKEYQRNSKHEQINKFIKIYETLKNDGEKK